MVPTKPAVRLARSEKPTLVLIEIALEKQATMLPGDYQNGCIRSYEEAV